MEVAITAILLALVHLLVGKLRFLEGIPRSRWLSAAGGIAVAYVFVRLLPELAKAQERIEESTTGVFGRLDDHAYVIALFGLAVFYGVERLTVRSRNGRSEQAGSDAASRGVFWLSITSFAAYTTLIGYALEDEATKGTATLLAFAIAMGLHFAVNDYGLREHHKESYTRVGRWVLASAVIGGWLLSRLFEVPERALLSMLAFLAGGIVLNVLKEELPERRQSRFSAFLIGALAYAALLQVI